MSDIQADIMATAISVSDAVSFGGYEQNALAIARAILAERERHGWQNIDTVPKDGTIVDLWHVRGFRVVDEWWDAEDGWTGGWLEDQFTHWMKSPIANP